jgi:3-phosphoshikimate 1-carboxyvinyltransferase
VLGLAVDGVLVENVATTGKTVPDFVDRWTSMIGTAPAGAPH